MSIQEQEKLLDTGYMLLEPFEASTIIRNPSNTGTVRIHKPVIRAKYGPRRTWYVLQRGFASSQQRDEHLQRLLKLPKYALG
ncbi:hypothetical protein ACFPAF_16790 [Hymenobacter endophyticus]|uniref:Uncharacterized protein n=1 Tax=Hymenobacter endophyticus TaxID=3076335 RepID=A0ABU3TL03_9BACT|nr:hypothetical protein [Hymenobacter endophyticus]MDU0372061.1 hypothetical protein [Hymenobacter endophyticus]